MDTLDTKFSTEEETDGARLGTLLPENLNSQFPTNLEGTYKMGRNAGVFLDVPKKYQWSDNFFPQIATMNIWFVTVAFLPHLLMVTYCFFER